MNKEIIKEFSDQFFASTRGRNDLRRAKIQKALKAQNQDLLKKTMKEYRFNGKWHWAGKMEELEKWEKEIIKQLLK